jgi:hypothetical protein
MKRSAQIVAVILVLLVAAGALLWPKVHVKVHELLAQVEAENDAGFAFMADAAKIEAVWMPPTPQPDGRWFPDEIDGWKLTAGAPFTNVSELNLQRNGYGATYQRGGERIEAKAILVTQLERDALFARAAAKAKHDEQARSERKEGEFIQIGEGQSEWKKPTFVEFSHGDGERLFCRSFGQWFFYMQSHDGPDLKPFSAAWLRAIDAHPTL